MIWVCVLLMALTPIAAHASSRVQDAMDEILARMQGEMSLQEWVDSLAPEAGSGTDNYILALNHLDVDFDASSYARALVRVLAEGSISNPVTRQRAALTLISCGGVSLVPQDLADNAIGKLGTMSYVYGLHLLNNGAPSRLWTADSLVDKLAELQKADGGWAVTGNYGDTDVTAMCLQALACYKGDRDVSGLIEGGVARLAQLQLENGGFASMGNENVESSAQVTIALCSLGIDPLSDDRFVKDGSTLLDALLAYRLPDGGYSHLPGKTENPTANMQVLAALSVLDNPGHYYDVYNAEVIDVSQPRSWKIYAWAGIGALAVIGAGLSLLKKRGRLKRVLFILVVAAIAAAGVYMINVESAGAYYSAQPIDEVAGYVNLSINCDLVAGRASDGSTPEDGVILPRTQFPFAEGDTVFDVLTRAVKEHKLQMEYQGATAGLAYVNGINYLYEFAYGDLSGWMYSVGGEFLSVGCGSCPVKDGDEIVWAYTLNLGEDLK